MCWFHSLTKPKVSKTINPEYIHIAPQLREEWASVRAGNKSKISTSKIAKTSATKKKWRENDIRCCLRVENPHSNGLCSSRSESLFLDSALPSNSKATDSVIIPNSWVINTAITRYEFFIYLNSKFRALICQTSLNPSYSYFHGVIVNNKP